MLSLIKIKVVMMKQNIMIFRIIFTNKKTPAIFLWLEFLFKNRFLEKFHAAAL